jgi:hypothetical protein
VQRSCWYDLSAADPLQLGRPPNSTNLEKKINQKLRVTERQLPRVARGDGTWDDSNLQACGDRIMTQPHLILRATKKTTAGAPRCTVRGSSRSPTSSLRSALLDSKAQRAQLTWNGCWEWTGQASSWMGHAALPHRIKASASWVTSAVIGLSRSRILFACIKFGIAAQPRPGAPRLTWQRRCVHRSRDDGLHAHHKRVTPHGQACQCTDR